MNPGEAFEIKCVEYLKGRYGNNNITFEHEGSMDSTISDISVLKNGNVKFFIEAKDTTAQSGQFVLLPDENTKNFIFSPKNRSLPNEMTEIIINYMNKDFERFNNAGTAGEALNIDSAIFVNWIIEHYKERNVKYVISYHNDYIILPIRKFADYFDVTAKYRIKKSGSSEPAKKDIPTLKETILNVYPNTVFSTNGKKLYASINVSLSKDRFVLGRYTYYFSSQASNLYEVRRLSNTYNMNVIFSIKSKCPQINSDLAEFETELYNFID